MNGVDNLLLNVLRQPRIAAQLSPFQWDACVHTARRHRVLARLSFLIEETVPPAAIIDPRILGHLQSARAIGDQHERIMRWEAGRMERALEPTGAQIVLLKGAAYLMAGLPPARGRIYSDLDIMVPFAKLGAVEAALVAQGWEHEKSDPYDQRYYREWMHELPPLRHNERKTVLDVHHTILPRTGRLHPDPGRLFEAAVRIENTNLWTLSPADMVLHSAAHLFQDGDLSGGLRDLVDLYDLFQYFSARDGAFWTHLVSRAGILDLSRPLFYALRYSEQIIGTQIPQQAIKACESAAPRAAVLKMMDALVYRAIVPSEPIDKVPGASFARWCLYVRSHYLRMPPYLLFRHLLRKAVVRG